MVNFVFLSSRVPAPHPLGAACSFLFTNAAVTVSGARGGRGWPGPPPGGVRPRIALFKNNYTATLVLMVTVVAFFKSNISLQLYFFLCISWKITILFAFVTGRVSLPLFLSEVFTGFRRNHLSAF